MTFNRSTTSTKISFRSPPLPAPFAITERRVTSARGPLRADAPPSGPRKPRAAAAALTAQTAAEESAVRGAHGPSARGVVSLGRGHPGGARGPAVGVDARMRRGDGFVEDVRLEGLRRRVLREAAVEHLVDEFVHEDGVLAHGVLVGDAQVIARDARDAVEELEDEGGGDVLARRRDVIQSASLTRERRGGGRGEFSAGVDDEEARARARAILDAEEAPDVEVVDAVLVEHRGGLLAVLPEPDRAEEDLGACPGTSWRNSLLTMLSPRGGDEQLREHRAPREGERGRGPARGARDDARGSECAPTAPDSRGEKAGSFRLLHCASVRPACADDFAHPSRRSLMTPSVVFSRTSYPRASFVRTSGRHSRTRHGLLPSGPARSLLGRLGACLCGSRLGRSRSPAPVRPPRPVRRRRHPGRPPASFAMKIGTVGALTLSVTSSVSIVIVNKYLISTLGFRYVTFLTSLHMVVTVFALRAAHRVGLLEPKPIDRGALLRFAALTPPPSPS